MLFYAHVRGVSGVFGEKRIAARSDASAREVVRIAVEGPLERARCGGVADRLVRRARLSLGESRDEDGDGVHREGDGDRDGDRLQVQPHRLLAVGRQRRLVGHLARPVADVEDADAGEADTEPLAVLDDPDRRPVQRKHGREKHQSRPRQRERRADEGDGGDERPDPEQEPPPLLCRSDVTDAGLVVHTDLIGLREQKRVRIRRTRSAVAAVSTDR